MSDRDRLGLPGCPPAIWPAVLLVILSLPVGSSAQSTSGAEKPDPVASELESSRARIDFERGRYGLAVDRLDRLGNPDPGARYYRGLSLLALKQAERALTEFQAVKKVPGAPAEVSLDLAIAQLGVGDAVGASETLRPFLAAHPDDPFGRYFLGVALFRQKRYDEAVAELDRAASDARLTPYRDFYRGLSSYAKGDPDFRSDLDRFQSGRGSDSSATGAVARRLLDVAPQQAFRPTGAAGSGRPGGGRGPNGVDGPDPDRRYNLALITGYEYDTNVALVPSQSFTPIGLGSRGRPNDSRWALSAFGDYRLIQNDRIVLGLIGSTYDTWQFRQTAYNFQDYMGGAYSNIALGERWILGGRYEFHESLLGGKQFGLDHRLTPNLTLREGEVGHTTFYYEFESLDISNLPILVPAQNRSSEINSVGVTQAFYLMEGAGRLFFGYRFDQANARGSDYDRHTNQLNARLEIPLPGKIVADVGGRYFFDNYEHPNSLDFFGRPRSDRRVEARIGAQKFLTKNLSVRVEYTYTNNDSNVRNLFDAGPFSYNRQVLSTLMVVDF